VSSSRVAPKNREPRRALGVELTAATSNKEGRVTFPTDQISPDQNVPLGAAALSRRRLFALASRSAAAIVIAFTAGIDTAGAQSKVKKAVAKYQDTPKNGQQCADCRFFRPPKACQLVQGDISANGWCSFFAKKA
jgi:hypothetical protein